MAQKRFRLGEWTVDASANCLQRGDERRQLEPRAMDVLARLCREPGEVLSAEHLMQACWGGGDYGDNPLHKIITQLRRALGDSSSAPAYIETIRKRGYRIVAEVQPEGDAGSGSWVHAAPFRGLEPFEEQHAPIFFGRGAATDKLVATVGQQAAAGCALVLVLGPSGAGKTSLIRAGLLPRLTSGAAQPRVACVLHMNCGDIGEISLFHALGSAMLDAETPFGAPVFPGASGDSLAAALGRDAASIAAMLAQQLAGAGAALCIDHLEAIFRLPHVGEPERQRFIAALDTMARSGLLVILACRNDFYPHIVAYPALLELKQRNGHFDVHPPTRSELAQIVRQPARAACIEFGCDPASGIALDEILCDAISSGHDTLPLLQYCLQELYLQRGADDTLSYAVFDALGGIEGAIGARAEQVVSALTPAQIAALSGVLALLVQVSENDVAVTSRRAPWAALRHGAQQELVKVLVEARLFVSDLHGGQPSFGIAHEAILRRWPRVLAWTEQHRQTLQLHTRTSAQAARWEAGGRSRDLLLPGGLQVTQARALLDQPEFPLGPQERAFIAASVARARLGERLRLLVLAVVLGLGLLAAGLGLSAHHARQLAEQRRNEAEGLTGFMLDELVEKLRPIGRLDLLDRVSARALAYLSKSDGSAASAAALNQRAQALHVISEVAVARANPVEASAALQAARSILDQQLAAAPNDKEVLKSLGANAFMQGNLYFDQKDWNAAHARMSEYLQFSERLGRLDPNDTLAWIEQAYAHNSLGSVALERGDPVAAARAFDASLALKTRALAQAPANQALAADLADSLSWAAAVQEKLGELDAAARLYKREMAIVQGLHARAPGDGLYAHRLANAHSHKGDLQVVLGEGALARRSFEEAQRLLRAIIDKDGTNKAWQATLATVSLKLLDLDAHAEAPAAQGATLAQLHAAVAALSALQPKKVNLRRLLATVELRQAAHLLREHKLDEARQLAAGVIATLEALREKAADDPKLRDVLVEVLLFQSELDQRTGLPARARASCQAAAAMLQPLATGRDYHVLAPWVRAQLCAGKEDQVSTQRALLSKIGYREAGYLRYVQSQPPTKGASHNGNTDETGHRDGYRQ